jgi:hypothetical protein
MGATKTQVLLCVAIGLLIAASTINCREPVTSKGKVERHAELDLSQMETVLRESLVTHAKELGGMLTGVDVFAGPRQQVDANTWRLGQWTITRSPEGFRVGLSIDIYRSDMELGILYVVVRVDRRDERLTVADWKAWTKEMKRVNNQGVPGSSGDDTK